MNAGLLANSNDENTATISDQDFLLWGDNGLPLSAKRGSGIDSVLSVIQRKWLVTATGNSTNPTPVELHIDAARLPVNPMGYWLVIDRSGQGNYAVDNLEYILPDRISNGKVIYKNVVWDKDGSGKDNFGFAQAKELFTVVRKITDPSCTDETAGAVRIEIVAGKAPYQYSLTNPEEKISRNWRQSEKSANQKELVAGNYALSVMDADKDKIVRNFSLAMPDALYIDLGPDQKISLAHPIVLDVSSQVPDSVKVTYRWENSFGFSSTEKEITATEPGIYKVFVTKEKDGCVFTDDVTISGEESQRVAVYPNILHANDPYNVSISLEEPARVSVKVVNVRGVEIYAMEGFDRSEYQFIASFKDTGMYLVMIQTPKGIETRKVVVY